MVLTQCQRLLFGGPTDSLQGVYTVWVLYAQFKNRQKPWEWGRSKVILGGVLLTARGLRNPSVVVDTSYIWIDPMAPEARAPGLFGFWANKFLVFLKPFWIKFLSLITQTVLTNVLNKYLACSLRWLRNYHLYFTDEEMEVWRSR